MKRIIIAPAVLLCAALALLPQVRSQGPGDKGAVLRQPWLDTGTNPAPTVPPGPAAGGASPSYLQGLLDSTGANRAGAPTGAAGSLMPYQTMEINNDILAKPEMGPWMVLIASYRGKDGPMRARKMVWVLRSDYKLPAYVFNFGAEEKRKELERVKKIIERVREGAKKENLTIDQPIRISHEHIEEYAGVLVGGYPSMDAARKARDEFRELKVDPKRFSLEQEGDLLDCKYITRHENTKGDVEQGCVFISPFHRAFPVHNPTIKAERPADANKLDVAALKRMNSAEDFSLFKCKRNYTLVIKQFNTPTVTAPRNEQPPSRGLADLLPFGKKAEYVDVAAENAHRFAEGLRKSRLEAYVLHMKYCSLVTIGGFDSLEDPNMLTMKNFIEQRLVPQMPAVEMFPKAMAWQVPH